MAAASTPRRATCDVLLGQAYFLRFDRKLWEARQPFAPLGTLYAASWLRQQGHSVALFDAMLARSEQEWAIALDHERPRVAVLYEDSFNYLSKMCLLRMRQAAFTMIDAARRRGLPTVVSGSDATDCPHLYLARGAAAVVLGEGEITLGEVVPRLLDGRALDEVAGLALPAPGGTVTRTAARSPLRALDDLPLPAWDLVDVARYRQIWRSRHGHHAMNLATTRGCPYHCNWCAKPIYGQRYAVRSVARVVDEMQWLKATYGPDDLWIVDDVFGLRPGWLSQFAAEVTARDARIPFRCLVRADQTSPAFVRALADAGCHTAWLGAESGSQRVLDAMEKGIGVDDIRQATRLLRAAGIRVCWFLQFGYPGESMADIDLTIALVDELQPDDIGISVSYPLPGTPFYDRVRADLGEKQNWFDSADLAMMFQATYPQPFYRTLHRLVHRRLRCRRTARELRQRLARPWTVRPGDLYRAADWLWARVASIGDRWHLRHLAAAPVPDANRTRVRAALSPAAAAVPTGQEDALPQEAP
jgi:radical SAM superfamily enzyme YgiQ (UPF0313 family)